MSCSTAAIIVGGIIVALLFIVFHFDPISRYEREERRFRRWKEKQERENHASPPDNE